VSVFFISVVNKWGARGTARAARNYLTCKSRQRQKRKI